MIDIIRLKAIARKEFIQIIRDYRSLFMAIAIPIILLIIFGYALSTDVDEVNMVIWDQDKSTVSRDLILGFRDSSYFNIIKYVNNYKEIDKLINRDKIFLALVIPRYFSEYLRFQHNAPVQTIIDGTDSNTANIIKGYVDNVIGNYNQKLLVEGFAKYGKAYKELVSVRPRVLFNENLTSTNYIVPGVIAVVMMVISALLTALTIAKEWERGTMEQLISTPIKATELIIGKCIPYFIIVMLDLLIAFLMSQFMFFVPFRGSILNLFLFSAIFLFGALGLGIYISIATKSQFMASQVTFITTFLPAFLLSGFSFPIINMPPVVQFFTNFLPIRYFVTILKGVYLKGIGIDFLWREVIYLILFAVLMVSLSHKSFKKKIT